MTASISALLPIHSQWGEALDARLREHLPGREIRAVPRGVPAAWPGDGPHIFLAAPMGVRDPAASPRPSGWGAGPAWVQLASVGFDGYPDWLLRATRVSAASGTSSEVIAEFALACILAANKRLPERWIAEPADWKLSAAPPLRGSVLGLVGLGGIGQALAAKALALGMQVLALRRRPGLAAPEGVRLVASLEELLANSDHLVLAAPATAETRHLIDGRALAHAKPGLHLINVARGSLIDQDALLSALDQGQLGRASLDVTEPEPLPAGHPLYRHPRVFLSPHTSAISPLQQQELVERFVDNLARFERGEPLIDELDDARRAQAY